MTDDTERTWWLFELPDSLAWAPGETEGLARRALAQNQHPGAPVASYPCRGSRRCSRAALAAALLGALAGCSSGLPPEPPIVEVVTLHAPCEPAPPKCWPELAPPPACGRKQP